MSKENQGTKPKQTAAEVVESTALLAVETKTLDVIVLKAPLLMDEFYEKVRELVIEGYRTLDDRTCYDKEESCLIMVKKLDVDLLG